MPVLTVVVDVVVVVVVDVAFVADDGAADEVAALAAGAGCVLGTPGTCARALEALKSKPDSAIATEVVSFILCSKTFKRSYFISQSLSLIMMP